MPRVSVKCVRKSILGVDLICPAGLKVADRTSKSNSFRVIEEGEVEKSGAVGFAIETKKRNETLGNSPSGHFSNELR